MLNAANLVTMARIAVAPVFLWFLYEYHEPGQSIDWILLAAFILIAASDGLDGALARKNNTVTQLGKLLDPIADKVLIGGTFLVLSLMSVVPWWVTIAILLREVGVTIYRLVVVKNRVIAASSGGKLKTVVQAVAVGFYISPLGEWLFNPQFDIGFGLLYGSVFLTWWTALQYIRAAQE